MSVWKFPSYRDDALQKLAEVIPINKFNKIPYIDLLNFQVEEHGNYECVYKTGKANKILNEVDWEDKLRSSIVYPERNNHLGFHNLLDNTGKLYHGIRGVYRFAELYLSQAIHDSWHLKERQKYVDLAYLVGSMAGMVGPKFAYKNTLQMNKTWENHMLYENAARRTFLHLITKAHNRRENRKLDHYSDIDEPIIPVKIPDHVPKLHRKYHIYIYRGLIIFKDRLDRDAYVFIAKDLDRIYTIIRGVSLYLFYFQNYANGAVYPLAIKVVNYFLNTVRKLNQDQCNYVCRAWDVIFFINLALLASDVNTRALREQMKKYQEEGLDRVFHYNDLLKIVEEAKIKDKIELLTLHRCFPCPDYDYFGAMHRQEKLYENINPFFEDAEEEMHEFGNYYKMLMMRAYKSKHGRFPGDIKEDVENQQWHDYYPNIPDTMLKPHMIDDIDLLGWFDYKEKRHMYIGLLKDKAICPENIEELTNEADLGKLPLDEKNYLLNMLLRKERINVNDIDYDMVPMDVKAEDKPEAKKPFGRWFFEAHSLARLKHSEYEASINAYAKHFPGSIIGLSTAEMVNKINKIVHPQKYEMDQIVKPLIISFDLAKFSPHYPGELHELFDSINAELFDRPELLDAHKIHHQGNIHYIKKNVHHVLPKPYCDFEGFSAKNNTLMHATVMGYAIHRARRDNIITKGVNFATLIDDGLMRVELKGEEYDSKIPILLNSIEDTYKMCGFDISWDKTFISRDFGIFLNDITYNGRVLYNGVKALMKIDNNNETAIGSFIDDVTYLEAKCRAALKAGCVSNITYYIYCHLFVDSLFRWHPGTGESKLRLHANLIFWLFGPIPLGGFGMKSVLQLCGSIGYQHIPDQIGVLRQVANRSPDVFKVCQDILTQPLRKKHAKGTIVAPGFLQRDDHILRPKRGLRKLQLGLLAHIPQSCLLQDYVQTEDVLITDYAETITQHGIFPAPIIRRLYRSSIQNALENVAAKFLRSRSALKIIGKRAVTSCYYAARNDIKQTCTIINRISGILLFQQVKWGRARS